MGSSVGPAVSEIISRATAQSMGDTNQAAINNIGAILQKQNEINKTYSLAKQTSAAELASKMADLRSQFRDNEYKIRYQIGLNDQARASASMDNFNKIRDTAYAIQEEYRAYENNLKLWAVDQGSQIVKQVNAMVSQTPTAEEQKASLTQVNNPLQTMNSQFGKATNTTTPTYSNPMDTMLGFLDLNTATKKKEDEYPYVINA
jgi:hypothetical protein